MLYTPTTTDIEKMNRTDLVFELAKKCHIDHYHRAITWPTEILRKLLNWYNTHNFNRKNNPILCSTREKRTHGIRRKATV